jgi:hypothetical protein
LATRFTNCRLDINHPDFLALPALAAFSPSVPADTRLLLLLLRLLLRHHLLHLILLLLLHLLHLILLLILLPTLIMTMRRRCEMWALKGRNFVDVTSFLYRLLAPLAIKALAES